MKIWILFCYTIFACTFTEWMTFHSINKTTQSERLTPSIKLIMENLVEKEFGSVYSQIEIDSPRMEYKLFGKNNEVFYFPKGTSWEIIYGPLLKRFHGDTKLAAIMLGLSAQSFDHKHIEIAMDPFKKKGILPLVYKKGTKIVSFEYLVGGVSGKVNYSLQVADQDNNSIGELKAQRMWYIDYRGERYSSLTYSLK